MNSGVADTKSKGKITGWITVPAAYILIAMLLKWPDTAAQAAQAALETWYHSVVPALFPFMMLMPLITGSEAAQIYEKMLGRMMKLLFRLPGGAAPAVVTGMVAGSPAGAIAAGRVAENTGMNKGQLLRIAGCMCGFSPAFLMSGVGNAVMGNVNAGLMLMKTQICTQLIMLTVTRWYSSEEKMVYYRREEDTAGTAVLSILTVAAYMMIFSVVAALTVRIAGNGRLKGIICILEVTAGAGYIAGINLDYEVKLMILAGICGFGGISIFAQNMKILAKYGVSALQFIKWKIACALVSVLVMYIQINTREGITQIIMPDWLNLASFLAIILVIPAAIRLKKHIS